MKDIINMITRRLHKLDEIIEEKENIVKTSSDEFKQEYNAGYSDALRNEAEFLGLILVKVEDEIIAIDMSKHRNKQHQQAVTYSN